LANYGHAGAWTESLGVTAPLQEMMLQSWDGALRLFPAWPRGVDCRFERFRAEGAFLVTASWSKGNVRELEIRSEKGARCRLYPAWPAERSLVDDAGVAVKLADEGDGRFGFDTKPGGVYRLK
jgi:hypothetical protein